MKEFFTLLSVKFGNRGSSRKKSKFLNWYLPQVKNLGYAVDIISGKGNFSRVCNVMIGDWKKAKHLVIVPYDTPVCTFYPIPYYPFDIKKNQKILFRCMMIQLCFSILLALLSLTIVYRSLQLATLNDYILLLFGGVLFAISILFGKGIANRNNFNRNNAALSIFTQILSEKPKDVAFMLIDSASGSLKGYGLLQERYGSKLMHMNALILDCVGTGEQVAIASSKSCPKTKWTSCWQNLHEEHATVNKIFSMITILARGTLVMDELKVLHTGCHLDREVDFDQMVEMKRIVEEIIQDSIE